MKPQLQEHNNLENKKRKCLSCYLQFACALLCSQCLHFIDIWELSVWRVCVSVPCVFIRRLLNIPAKCLLLPFEFPLLALFSSVLRCSILSLTSIPFLFDELQTFNILHSTRIVFLHRVTTKSTRITDDGIGFVCSCSFYDSLRLFLSMSFGFVHAHKHCTMCASVAGISVDIVRMIMLGCWLGLFSQLADTFVTKRVPNIHWWMFAIFV